jgi:hypothetical protein
MIVPPKARPTRSRRQASAVEAAGSPAAGLAFLVLDGDRFVVEANDPCVGESDAKDVAGEVLEHGLFAAAAGGDVEGPTAAPHRVALRTATPRKAATRSMNERLSLERAKIGRPSAYMNRIW